MQFILALLLLSPLTVFSSEITEKEFNLFYDNEILVSNKCGLNTKHFLTHLKNKGVDLKQTKGFVVSIHEDMGLLNHFEGRWGRRDTYENGISYNRSNWYFHVFAVIDGKAYDFSHESGQAIDFDQYLISSYLPKYKTDNIFLLGRVTKDDLLKKFLNIKLNIYPLDDYEKDLGPAIYRGSFSDLFEYYGVSTPKYSPESNTENIPTYKKEAFGNFKLGETTQFYEIENAVSVQYGQLYKNIELNLNGDFYPMVGKDHQLCQTLGFTGSLPRLLKTEKLEKVGDRYLDLGCTRYNVSEDIMNNVKCSFRYKEHSTYGHAEIIKNFGCANLEDIL